MSRAPLDWTRTGTLQAMGEWLRAEIGATVLVAVRASDAVLLLEPGADPASFGQMAVACVSRLAEQVARDRRQRATPVRAAHFDRVEKFRVSADAIAVLVIRPRDSVFVVDGRCAPADAAGLVADYVSDLVAVVGANPKYKGARLVFDGVPA